MNITVSATTNPADLLNKPARHGHMVGVFTDLRHLTIDPTTGTSRTGLQPGLVGSFREQPSELCRGGNTATYVQYGDVIELKD